MGYVLLRGSLAISSSAPRHSNAGGVSPENAAQQNFPPGATWHRSPSFFRQNPQLFRHSSDWLYHRQRVSRQTFPPSVPMLRKTGDATVLHRLVEHGIVLADDRRMFDRSESRQGADFDAFARNITNAAQFADCRANPARMAGVNSFCFIDGSRSVPPATIFTSPSCLARSATASSSVFGRSS